MQKEEIKFVDSTVFEGMTSIRSIIKGIDSRYDLQIGQWEQRMHKHHGKSVTKHLAQSVEVKFHFFNYHSARPVHLQKSVGHKDRAYHL